MRRKDNEELPTTAEGQVEEALPTVLVDESTPPPEKVFTVGGKNYTEEELTKVIALATQMKQTPVEEVPEEPVETGWMKLCSCWVKLNQLGTNVQIHNVTPAEVCYLTADHHAFAGGSVVHDVKVTGKVQRSPKQEKDRLKQRYPTRKVDALFPGAIPMLPTSYKEAVTVGLEANINTDKLIVQSGV